MEKTQGWDVPAHAGPGEEQQRFWGKNETMPDHVETIIPLPPTCFLACCLSSLPHLALCPCHHWKCLKRPRQEDRYYHVNNCLEGQLSKQSIWLHKNTKEGNGVWAKSNRTENLTRKNHFTSCMTFLVSFLVCKIEKVITTPCFTVVVMSKWDIYSSML